MPRIWRPRCGGPTPAGFVDDVAVTQQSGARPYYEQVEVASMVLDVTYRPTD